MTNPALFQNVFGSDWDKLPSVMRRHYANRVNCHDQVTVEGHLDVENSFLGRLLKPFMRLSGTFVPYEGKHIPTIVHYITYKNAPAFHLDRLFHFPGKPPYRFCSRMIPLGKGEMVEVMRSRMGWRLHYSWDGTKVILAHRGFALYIFGRFLHLPLEAFLGRGYAEEWAIDDDSFGMMMEMRHPLFGKVFGYKGRFTFTEEFFSGIKND